MTEKTPADAGVTHIPVFAGDIFVLATDGLFNNVTMGEVAQIVQEDSNAGGRPVSLYYVTDMADTAHASDTLYLVTIYALWPTPKANGTL